MMMREAIILCLALWVFIVGTAGPLHADATVAEQEIPHGFVDVKEVIPSVVLDIRYFTPHNFVGERIDGYDAPRCFLTERAAKALSKVQEELKTFSLSLKIYDCYRPQRAVDHFVR